MGIKERILGLRPLLGKESDDFGKLEELLDDKDLNEISRLRKQLKISFFHDTLGISLVKEAAFPQVKARSGTDAGYCREVNERIRKAVKKQYFQEFSHTAFAEISGLLAPHVSDLEAVKQAVALQLFCTERMHILLVGDPSTGKTDIGRSAATIAPISSSGNNGLVVLPKGKSLVPGLLPQADNGLCVIDDLRLVKNETKSLISAMDKGVVMHDKAGQHLKYDARASILATARPLGDRFLGHDVKGLRKQIPFDKELLSKFHLVFVMRKPGVGGFEEKKLKPGKLSEADIDFVREYIKEAVIEVKFPSALQEDVVEFVKQAREHERNYLVSLSPGISSAFIALAKASARMELRNMVSDVDLIRVKNIIRQSLETS